MFDDPKLRLQQMEQALKEAEEAPEEEDWLQEYKDLLGEPEPPVRNQASNRGRKPEAKSFSRTVYADEEMTESDALYVEKPKRKGAGPYVLLALLELIAIMLVILWWIKWMG